MTSQGPWHGMGIASSAEISSGSPSSRLLAQLNNLIAVVSPDQAQLLAVVERCNVVEVLRECPRRYGKPEARLGQERATRVFRYCRV